MIVKSLLRLMSTSGIIPKLTSIEEKVIRKIEIERKALMVYQEESFKQGKIQPMQNIIEKLQQAVKLNQLTPIEKLEQSLSLKPTDSFDTLINEFSLKYGDLAQDLYGTDKDNRLETIKNRGEIVPSIVKDEDAMIEYRKYYVVNYTLPGCIENIHPHKFLRLKPIEEFPLMPLIPINPMTLKRWQEELLIKKKEGYRIKIDKGQVYTGGLVILTFFTFLVLLYLLFNSDEDNWVQIQKGRKKADRNKIEFY